MNDPVTTKVARLTMTSSYMLRPSSSSSIQKQNRHGGLPERIVFLHIPKTGGTSVHELLKGLVDLEQVHPERLNNFSDYSSESFKDYRLFSAHMDARTLPQIPDPKYTFTILREPKARILSLYYFWKSHTWETIEKNNLGGPLAAKSLDLLSFLRVRDGAIAVNIDNAQSRAVWGHLHLFQPMDSKLLQKVIDAVDNFDLIGIMEDLEHSVRRIFTDFGITEIPTLPRLQVGDVRVSKHRNREEVSREPITFEIDAELERLTTYDRPLYEFVKAKFDNK